MTIYQHASFDVQAAGLNATSNKNPAVAKMVAAWENKNAKRVMQGSGLALMAMSLTACGSSSTTPAATTTTATTTTATTTTVVAGTAQNLSSRGDTLTGTAGDDTFDGQLVNEGGVANVQTMTSTDTITDASTTDNDTLTIGYNTAVTPFSITNIENITLTDQDATTETINLVNVTGMDTLTLLANVTAGDIDNVANIVTLNITNNTVANNVDYVAAAVALTTDTQVINLTSHTAGTLTLDAGIESATINSLGAVANVMTLTATGVATVTVTGAAGFTGTFGTAATTIDAEAATGVVSIVQTGAQLSNVTTGTGNDTIDLSGNFIDSTTAATADTVDGGAGANTLNLTSAEAAAVLTVAEFALVTNIQTITIDDDATNDDISMVALGITTLEYNGLVGTSDVVAVSGGEIQYDLADVGNNARNYSITGTGTTDSVTIDINGVDIGAGQHTYTGIETLNIATSGTSLMDGAHVMTATAATETMNISGTGTLTLGNVTADAITSTMTAGTLNLGTMQAATNITGGAEAMTVIGSTASDIINGGGGIDIIDSGTGDDSISLGAGADDYQIVSITNGEKDIVTDFTVGTDDIDVGMILTPDDAATIAIGGLAAADYLDVSGGAITTTITGNRGVGIFEFSNAADLLGAGVAGTFDATTATGAQLEAAVIAQLATQVAVAATTGSDNDLLLVMYDEAGNAVVVTFQDAATDTTIDAGDDFHFTVLEDVAQGTLTVGDFI